jgi:hypothetical protein
MIRYEDFGLPRDGLTRVELVGQYGTSNLHGQGWSVVGMFHAMVKDGGEGQLYEVFRMTETEALQAAIGDAGKAATKRDEAKTKAAKLEAQLTETLKEVANLKDQIRARDDQAEPL